MVDSEAPADLSAEKLPDHQVAAAQPHEVHSYRELVYLAGFLNVMTKDHHLLYRGQADDRPLLPTLRREEWSVPGTEPGSTCHFIVNTSSS